MTTPADGHGEILGTLQYMSPEQLEGKDADARSDIFAFGLVLYELLTAAAAFEGSSQASLIAAILKEEPPPMASLQPLTPPGLERTLRKCLAKDPDRRWQSAADSPRRAIVDRRRWSSAPPRITTDSQSMARARRVDDSRRVSRRRAFLRCRLPAHPHLRAMSPVSRSNPPEKTAFSGLLNATVSAPQLALSPDGLALAFVANAQGARPVLWLRRIEETDAHRAAWHRRRPGSVLVSRQQLDRLLCRRKVKEIPASGGPVQVIHRGASRIRAAFPGGPMTRSCSRCRTARSTAFPRRAGPPRQ